MLDGLKIMSEKVAYKALKDHMAVGMDRITRIENLFGVGDPDLNYCIDGVEGWVEIKYPTEPKRSSTKLFGSNHPLSQDQKNWILSQLNAGGRAWILIVSDQRWILVHGEHADNINEMTLSNILGICHWTANKPVKGKEPWAQLRKILAS